MAVGSGLAGSFGTGVETAYGTSPSPVVSAWTEIASSNLKRNKHTVQGGGMSGGNAVDRGARRTQPWKDAGGTVSLEVTQNGLGRWLSHFTGTAFNATQQAATAAYAQSYPLLADNSGKSLTIQQGIPDAGGTPRPYTFLGCKPSSLELSSDATGLLMASIDIDAQQVTETPTLVTPTYTAAQVPFHGGQFNVTIGTASTTAATPLKGVKSASVKADRAYANERIYANAVGLKAEPITNGKVAVTGSLSIDSIDKTQVFDAFAADTPVSLAFSWFGALIASTYFYQVTVTLPYVFFDTDTPTLDNPDVVNTGVNFTALYDGTNPAITYGFQSTDTTI